MTEPPKESSITGKSLPPRTPGALPHVDAFQANETVHWPTMTKTLFYTGLVLIMIGGRFFMPHEVFEEVGLMVMGAGMFFFVIGLWRGKIAMEDSQFASKDKPESGPADR